MILKNLTRRRARTFLTVLGIALGVAAIITIGALADGLQSGYGSIISGSQADLVLSQPSAFDISYSSVDEKVEEDLRLMPEVKAISSMIQGFTYAESQPFFVVFGYPENSFALERFPILQGVGLYSKEAAHTRGKPVLLGSAASELLDKTVGDSVRLGSTLYRVIGIYETGGAFEDSAALLRVADAQDLVGKPNQVSLFYIKLKSPSLTERFKNRVGHQWPELDLSGAKELEDKQVMEDFLRGFVWVVGGLAIVIGGVGMMNSQLMAVNERTREIGVLRAVGWSARRVLGMILGEAIGVCLAGGFLGIGLGWLLLWLLKDVTVFISSASVRFDSANIVQAMLLVLLLGLMGGLYPAWRAARLLPVEALRYEGGSSTGKIHRLPFGGMAIQSLWQRTTRTLLTLAAISMIVGAMIALEAMTRGFVKDFEEMALGANAQVMVRQADVVDTTMSAIDERIGAKIAAMPEVRDVDGMIITGILMPEAVGFFLVEGYEPNGFAIQRFKITEGKPLSGSHQILLGNFMAEALNKRPGDSIDLSGVRFRIVGIYESRIAWEEMGGVMSLRDAQVFAGRPRKVSMYGVQMVDPAGAAALAERINTSFPGTHAALASEFAEQTPDMQTSRQMVDGISFLTILIGGVGVLNTMLMSVFERTREIGVLRALGWPRRAVLGLILQELAILGLLGGLLGIAIAFGLLGLAALQPLVASMVRPVWDWDIYARAIGIALMLGILGGLYPAYRATRLSPVEALRYE